MYECGAFVFRARKLSINSLLANEHDVMSIGNAVIATWPRRPFSILTLTRIRGLKISVWKQNDPLVFEWSQIDLKRALAFCLQLCESTTARTNTYRRECIQLAEVHRLHGDVFVYIARCMHYAVCTHSNGIVQTMNGSQRNLRANASQLACVAIALPSCVYACE